MQPESANIGIIHSKAGNWRKRRNGRTLSRNKVFMWAKDRINEALINSLRNFKVASFRNTGPVSHSPHIADYRNIITRKNLERKNLAGSKKLIRNLGELSKSISG